MRKSMFEAAPRTLRRDFGSGIATLVADHMALDKISGGRERKMAKP